MIPIPSQRQPVFHSQPPQPRIRMQYSVPPMATTPPRHPGQYMPHFPSSPQNHSNQFFSPGDFPHGSDTLGRTPPSPMGQFFPGNIRYPQQAGPQRPHRPNDQFKVGSPDPTSEPIQSRTFVRNEVRREVHFTNPASPGYHSYPPGPGQPPNWNRHNMWTWHHKVKAGSVTFDLNCYATMDFTSVSSSNILNWSGRDDI